MAFAVIAELEKEHVHPVNLALEMAYQWGLPISADGKVTTPTRTIREAMYNFTRMREAEAGLVEVYSWDTATCEERALAAFVDHTRAVASVDDWEARTIAHCVVADRRLGEWHPKPGTQAFALRDRLRQELNEKRTFSKFSAQNPIPPATLKTASEYRQDRISYFEREIAYHREKAINYLRQARERVAQAREFLASLPPEWFEQIT